MYFFTSDQRYALIYVYIYIYIIYVYIYVYTIYSYIFINTSPRHRFFAGIILESSDDRYHFGPHLSMDFLAAEQHKSTVFDPTFNDNIFFGRSSVIDFHIAHQRAVSSEDKC